MQVMQWWQLAAASNLVLFSIVRVRTATHGFYKRVFRDYLSIDFCTSILVNSSCIYNVLCKHIVSKLNYYDKCVFWICIYIYLFVCVCFFMGGRHRKRREANLDEASAVYWRVAQELGSL